MAHVEKYNVAQVGHMFNHYGRQADDKVQRTNENINLERTHLNYNLAPNRHMTQKQYLDKRLQEITINKKRADTVLMADWVVTLPKTIPDGREKEFFQNIYNYLTDKYGENNTISAFVHMDETTPHIHFCFIPVAPEHINAKGKLVSERLCAKEVLNRKDLNRFHKDLEEYMEQAMQLSDCGLLNGATINGNRTMTQLKLETEQKQLNSIIQQKNDIIKTLDAEPPKKTLLETEKHYKARIDRETANNLKEQELYQKTQELDELQRKLSIKEQEINSKSYLLQENMQKLAKKQKQFDEEVANKINQLETEYQQKAKELDTKFQQEIINKVKEIQSFNAQTLVIDPKFAELQNQLYAQIDEEVQQIGKEGYDYEI